MAHLPHTGRWQLVDPRITAGLLGGTAPPFGILEVDFARLQGTARWWVYQSPLSNVAIDKTAHDTFSARYSLRGKSGAFLATLRDNGELEMSFYQGTGGLKCKAVPRGATTWRVSKMALLTCVGNPGWPAGPGHSALIGDRCVYTFERTGISAIGSNSGWKVLTTPSYLGLPENEARPIIIQELDSTKVNFSKVVEYVDGSTRADDDFFSSGWCSLQTALALKVGVAGRFEPRGLDTPLAVHDYIKSLRLVTKTYRIWNPAKTPGKYLPDVRAALAKSYRGVGPPTGADVRNWTGAGP